MDLSLGLIGPLDVMILICRTVGHNLIFEYVFAGNVYKTSKNYYFLRRKKLFLYKNVYLHTKVKEKKNMLFIKSFWYILNKKENTIFLQTIQYAKK